MPAHLPPKALDSGRAQHFGPRLYIGYFTANPFLGHPAIRRLPTRPIVGANHLPSKHWAAPTSPFSYGKYGDYGLWGYGDYGQGTVLALSRQFFFVGLR